MKKIILIFFLTIISVNLYSQAKIKCAMGFDYGTIKSEVISGLNSNTHGKILMTYTDAILFGELKSMEQYPIQILFNFENEVLTSSVTTYLIPKSDAAYYAIKKNLSSAFGISKKGTDNDDNWYNVIDDNTYATLSLNTNSDNIMIVSMFFKGK